MACLLSRQVEVELDDIWLYIANESSSIEAANRIIDSLTDQFLILARHPHIGRRRDDLRVGLRSIVVGSYIVSTGSKAMT
jgi:toxin ParE1/3/4